MPTSEQDEEAIEIEEDPVSPETTVARSHLLHFKMMLATWMTHFRSLGYIKDSTMKMLDDNGCKKLVELTVKDQRIRCVNSMRMLGFCAVHN